VLATMMALQLKVPIAAADTSKIAASATARVRLSLRVNCSIPFVRAHLVGNSPKPQKATANRQYGQPGSILPLRSSSRRSTRRSRERILRLVERVMHEGEASWTAQDRSDLLAALTFLTEP